MQIIESDNYNTKNNRFYKCTLCNYKCNRKNDYLKHCSTQKHLDMEYFNKYKHNPDKLNEYHKSKNEMRYVCECGRKYKYNSGLSRHKINCKYESFETKSVGSIHNTNEILSVGSNNTNTENITDLVTLVRELIEENKSIQEKLIEATNQQQPPSMIIQQNNNQHNHFSIKAYLNNECKNAMNLSDYVDQIKITFDDLAYMKEHGVVKVFENTFVKGLREMAETERPIHCSDKKRGNFYVKDDDMWMKDPENERIVDALKKITNQQCDVLKQWKNLNKDWLDNEKKQEHANVVTRKIVDIYGDKNQKKILNLLSHLEILKEDLQ
jgi:hypothetical protein